jgi:hypothetical protein
MAKRPQKGLRFDSAHPTAHHDRDDTSLLRAEAAPVLGTRSAVSPRRARRHAPTRPRLINPSTQTKGGVSCRI